MPGIYFPTAPTDPRPAVPIVINVGKVSSVIAMYDMQKFMIFQGGTKAPDKRLWKLLLAVAEILEFFYLKQTGSALTEVIANYLWALLTPYQIAALRALGNGGGIVINPSTGAPLNIAQFRYDFTVGDAGALMVDGDSSLTIPLTFVFLAQFEPSGVNETIGDPTQASLIDIVYQPNFVRFDLNQPVRDGERYIIWGLRGGNIVAIPNTGVQLPLPYQKGKFLTNDGTNLLWDDTWIRITASSDGWQLDGRTYLDASLDGYYLKVYWENTQVDFNFESTPPEAILVDGGGFIIEQDGFDVTQNPDWIFYIHKKSLL